MRGGLHCTVLLSLGLAASGTAQPPPTPAPPGDASVFTVFLKGVPIGTEDVRVDRSTSGTSITGSGRLGPPLDVVIRHAAVRYDPAWRPIDLTLDGTVRGESQAFRITFAEGAAALEITQRGQTSKLSQSVAADALVLPNPWFGAYEALAARLASTASGSELRAYIAPQGEIPVRVGDSSEERFQTAARAIAARRHHVTFVNPGGALDVEIWADEHGRLLRVRVPAQSLEVAREDIASVTTRRQTVSHPGDQHVQVPASGFNLAATITKPVMPARTTTRLPAVVLVGGSGPVDRDETAAGIPIFGLIAGALADAGFLVARYDKRGVGQSGGRFESATLGDYADDARTVVKYLAGRRDVDPKRIAVVGHSEGGLVALLAASKNKRIAALVTIATPSTPGADLILEQQQRALDRMGLSEADKQAKIDLQKKIQRAVVTGSGWDGIPLELRRQAETPWFHSFLTFDPARIMPRVRQPILVLQGELDRQVPASHADGLAALARRRKGVAADRAQVVRIAGVNHLLVPATTGEVDEYGGLKDKNVSVDLLRGLVDWLQTQLTTPKP